MININSLVVTDGQVVSQLTSQSHEMYCHDQKVVGSNPSRGSLGVHSTSVQVILEPNIA